MSALRMFRGDDRRFTFTLLEDGAPMDLTDADVRFTGKRHVSEADDDAPIGKSVGDGVEIDDPATSGICTVILAAADTEGLGGATLEYDVQVTRAGYTRTVSRGQLRIDHDVTTTAP